MFQYLELRYNSRLVRLLASFSYIISIILYMGVVLYAPCLALHTITGLPVVGLILLGGIVTTIYTVMVSYFRRLARDTLELPTLVKSNHFMTSITLTNAKNDYCQYLILYS